MTEPTVESVFGVKKSMVLWAGLVARTRLPWKDADGQWSSHYGNSIDLMIPY